MQCAGDSPESYELRNLRRLPARKGDFGDCGEMVLGLVYFLLGLRTAQGLETDVTEITDLTMSRLE